MDAASEREVTRLLSAYVQGIGIGKHGGSRFAAPIREKTDWPARIRLLRISTSSSAMRRSL